MALVGAAPINAREGPVDEGCVIEVRLDRSPSSLCTLDRAVVATMAVVGKEGLNILPLERRPRWAGGKTRGRLNLAA